MENRKLKSHTKYEFNVCMKIFIYDYCACFYDQLHLPTFLY